MKIAVIPIDNRPVCYDLIRDIAQIDEDIKLFMPPISLLGGLVKTADIEGIFGWFASLENLDAVVVALDTIAYGGLIPSRRSDETFEKISARLERFKKLLEPKSARVFAFSSVMRISNNNVNEEEKPYWDKFGKKIFDYSYNTHKDGVESCIKSLIPTEILDDYLKTRNRNFEINRQYLNWNFDTLIFSKDDCAEYGFNVSEARELEKLGGIVKTGADEIPLSLFARALHGKLKIAPRFLSSDKNLISNYEDISIENCVRAQILLAGCEATQENDADLVLIVNNFEGRQGEIVMNVPTKGFSGEFNALQGPFMIADVRFANGADNEFVKRFKPFDENFYGYAAWNTSANTLGSVICAAKIKFLAKNYNDRAFKKLEAVRFLDDWAYQANLRQGQGVQKEFEERVKKLLSVDFEANYSKPWDRKFEVRIDVKLL